MPVNQLYSHIKEIFFKKILKKNELEALFIHVDTPIGQKVPLMQKRF